MPGVERRLALPVAELLAGEKPQAGPETVGDDGCGLVREPKACLLDAPAEVDLLRSGTRDVRVEPADAVERRVTDGHVGAHRVGQMTECGVAAGCGHREGT